MVEKKCTKISVYYQRFASFKSHQQLTFKWKHHIIIVQTPPNPYKIWRMRLTSGQRMRLTRFWLLGVCRELTCNLQPLNSTLSPGYPQASFLCVKFLLQRLKPQDSSPNMSPAVACKIAGGDCAWHIFCTDKLGCSWIMFGNLKSSMLPSWRDTFKALFMFEVGSRDLGATCIKLIWIKTPSQQS